MARYIDSALRENEVVIYRSGIHWASQMPLIISGALLLPIGIGIIFWGVAIHRYATTEIGLTNHRILAQWGLVAKSTIELNARKLSSVSVVQSKFQRHFKFGRIVISGSHDQHVPGIRDPHRFKYHFERTFGDSDAIPNKTTHNKS